MIHVYISRIYICIYIYVYIHTQRWYDNIKKNSTEKYRANNVNTMAADAIVPSVAEALTIIAVNV